MADLSDLAANAPGGFKRHRGRIAWAGTMLLIRGFVTGLPLLDFVPRAVRYPAHVYFFDLAANLFYALLALYFFCCGIGLLLNYRWSRGLTLIGMNTWLTLGWSMTIVLACSTVREIGETFDIRHLLEIVLILLIFLVLVVACTLLVPALLRLLILPMDMQFALDEADSKQRALNEAGIRLMAIRATLVLLGLFLLWYYMMVVTWYGPRVSEWTGLRFAVIAVALIVSAILITTQPSLRNGAAVALATLAAFSTLSASRPSIGGPHFRYFDANLVVGFVITATLLTALQIQRERYRAAARVDGSK